MIISAGNSVSVETAPPNVTTDGEVEEQEEGVVVAPMRGARRPRVSPVVRTPSTVQVMRPGYQSIANMWKSSASGSSMSSVFTYPLLPE